MISSFNVDHFKNQLRTTWLGSEVIYLKKVESTNTYLKKIPSSDLVHGTIVITDNQTRGRGQYQKKWDSQPGKDLTFTIGLRPPEHSRLTLLTLGLANAAAKVIESYITEPVHLKWPNDILVGDKKISGFLTECVFVGQQQDRVCIGIGLNVSKRTFKGKLLNKATSLCMLTDSEIEREKLLSELLLGMEQAYHKWHKMDTGLIKSINNKMLNYGDWVRLQVNGRVKKGSFKFLGINEKGELIALNEELDVNTFSHEQIRIISNRTKISTAAE